MSSQVVSLAHVEVDAGVHIDARVPIGQRQNQGHLSPLSTHLRSLG